MSKSINIFFGQVGDILNRYKVRIAEKYREYQTNCRIIQTREYLCSELIESSDILQVSYENVHKVLNALTSNGDDNQDTFWEYLVDVYRDVREQHQYGNIEAEVLEEFSNRYADEIREKEFDEESIYLLVYLFNKIISIGGDSILENDYDGYSSIIYNILNEEYEYINELSSKNEETKMIIDKFNENIAKIVNELYVSNENITINRMINKINSLYSMVEQTISTIIHKNKDKENFKEPELTTLNSLAITRRQQADVDTDTSANYKLEIEGSYLKDLDKNTLTYNLKNGEHIELIPGTAYIIDKQNNNNRIQIPERVGDVLNESWCNIQFEFIIDPEECQQYCGSSSKYTNTRKYLIIKNNPKIGTTFNVRCKWTYNHNGELLSCIETLKDNTIKIIS